MPGCITCGPPEVPDSDRNGDRSLSVRHGQKVTFQHLRHARDYETLPATFATMIRIAMIDNLTRRAIGETTPTWRDT